MLLLNPHSVKFGSARWDDVAALAVDRGASRLNLEWSDSGPHVVFADVPEERLTIRVTRRLQREATFGPRPGDAGELVAYTSPTAADASRRRVRIESVVTAVSHEISAKAALQTVTLVGVSSNGAVDPVVIEDAADGSF
jgi:hypothetical protein